MSTAKSDDTLRALHQPKPDRVQADGRGRPTAVATQARFIAVAQVEDRWRIHDDWWRQEIHREYWRLTLEDGHPVVVFHDLIGGRWYRQTAGQRVQRAVPVSPLVPSLEERAPDRRRRARGKPA